MFVYSLAGKIASHTPIVRSYTRRKQEQDELNRQHVLQQAVELELSKQHIATAVTLLSDAFLDAQQQQQQQSDKSSSSTSRQHQHQHQHARISSTGSSRRPPSPADSDASGSSSGTATPNAAEPGSSGRKLRSVRSNPLMRLLDSAASTVVSSPTQAQPQSQSQSQSQLSQHSRSASSTPELIPIQNYAFAPTVTSGASVAGTASVRPASLANANLADQYIQSVHFLLSALSPTQAAQLPELSRRQMRMSLAQAIDRLDLAAASLSSEHERSSFWSARSQVSALDRLLRTGETRVSGPAPAPFASAYPAHLTHLNSYQRQHYAQGALTPSYDPQAYAQLHNFGNPQSRISSTRERAVEIATMPAHLAYGIATQTFSAMLLCTQLALSVAIPMIWLMLRMAPVNALRSNKKDKQAQLQFQHEGDLSSHLAAAGGLQGLGSTARNAASQMVEFANSPLGMYANAMFAKHAPSVHAGASAVWNFAEEQLSNSAKSAQSSADWQAAHSGTCPLGGHHHTSGAMATPSTDRTTISSSSSQRTLAGSPWPTMDGMPSGSPAGLDPDGDGKFLTWPKQAVSPRLRAISAPDEVAGQQGSVSFPASTSAADVSSASTSSAQSGPVPFPTAATPEPPVNKRRWSSLIGRGYATSTPTATRPPLPAEMTTQRQQQSQAAGSSSSSSSLHPYRALSVSTAYPARPSLAATASSTRAKHTRQHSWAPEYSSPHLAASASSSASSAMVPAPSAHKAPAHASASQQAMMLAQSHDHHHHQMVATTSQQQAPSAAPSFPEVLNSLSIQTSRTLSDPQSSYSLYNLVPGASLRRTFRKTTSRSLRQAVVWARTNGVLRAGVDAVCVGLEAALAGVEAWGDAEFEREEEGRQQMQVQMLLQAQGHMLTPGVGGPVAPCPCGQVHHLPADSASAAPSSQMASGSGAPAPPRGLGILLA